MPSRNVHVDDAHRRITEHITLEHLALDGDPADRTHRPQKLAHASYSWPEPILTRIPRMQWCCRALGPGFYRAGPDATGERRRQRCARCGQSNTFQRGGPVHWRFRPPATDATRDLPLLK